MKSASSLTKHLLEIVGLPNGYSLTSAYDLLNEQQKADELTLPYTCVEAGPTVSRLADLPWQRVYTLNIDNAFEVAFKNTIARREFDPDSLEVFNFCHGFSELRREKRCSLIHLHGTVESPEDGYVFSRDEYAQSLQNPNSWMLTLSQLIQNETFIVAGTSFDEVDVSFYLKQRSQRTIRGDVPPSVLVEPKPNKVTEKLCADNEFVLFEGTTLEFLDELVRIDERLLRPWVDNGRDGLSGLGLPRATRLKFSNTFETVPDVPEETANPARFLLGAELSWAMLAARSDIEREIYKSLRATIVEELQNGEAPILSIFDDPGSGKTSILKRLAFDFSRGSDAVFWYTGLGVDLSPKEIAEVFSSLVGPVLVFVDNFADALNTIEQICISLDKQNLLFVCAERDYRLPYIESTLSQVDYKKVVGHLGLSKAEASSLRDLHRDEGLSTIQTVSDAVFFGQVVGKTIAETNCRIQDHFKTIDDIVDSLILECDKAEVGAYVVVALARYCNAIGVRRNVLGHITQSDAVEYLLSDEAALPIKYSDFGSSFVVPKQGVIGERVLEKSRSQDQLFTAFVDLAKSIAPRVDRQAIKRKTPEAMLLGRLMDFDKIVKRFIDAYAEDFYTQLKASCGWNARYWEQLSLLKLDRFFASPDDTFMLEESLQHARSALSTEVHPFSLTTLAKVLFEAMEKRPLQRDSFFADAWGRINEAYELEKRWATRGATLFIVTFKGVIKFLDAGGQLTGEQYERLRDMVADTHALKIKDTRLADLRTQLNDVL